MFYAVLFTSEGSVRATGAGDNLHKLSFFDDLVVWFLESMKANLGCCDMLLYAYVSHLVPKKFS